MMRDSNVVVMSMDSGIRLPGSEFFVFPLTNCLTSF